MLHKITIFIYSVILTFIISGCNEVAFNDDMNISLRGSKKITLILDDNFSDPGAVAFDKNDGNLTSNISIESDLNTSKEGNYTISYLVTNRKSETLVVTREVVVKKVEPLKIFAPIDTNIEDSKDSGILYYADPGFNRVLKVDYKNWSLDELRVDGINPHSVDRAGYSDKFYVRTQNSYSFDVINFETKEVKSIDLKDHKPRAIGGYNKKYNIQLLSGKNMPTLDVIDVYNDSIIATLGIRKEYNKEQITSNAGNGSATGHGLWLDVDHFALIDRVNKNVVVYKVIKNSDASLEFIKTYTLNTITAIHAIERNRFPVTRDDISVFYSMGEGDITKGISPYVEELYFNAKTGELKSKRVTFLKQSNKKVSNISPTTHHGSVTPDGKYIVAPVLDGKVYFIDRKTMKIAKVLNAKLGAAHIEFSKSRDLAIITNHYSNYITIIDMKTLEVKSNIQIGFEHQFNSNNIHLFQPHFSYVSEDGKYYYTFATQDGVFLKINLDTLEIENTLHTGGVPEQAHS
jgi:hypothetical protein